MKKQRIGILTSGGDCAGLNSAIKWLVTAVLDSQFEKQYGIHYEVVGIKDGFKGLAFTDNYLEELRGFTTVLTEEIVNPWDRFGGTNLGTSRFSPYNTKSDTSTIVLNNIDKLGLEALVVLGGDGTLNIANRLSKAGVKVVGIPKTIDNDILGTDYCLGYETALEVITDIVDKLRTTAGSHKRVFVLETMGRYAGWLALKGGESCGAYIILIPEYDFSIERVSELLISGNKAGNRYEIIVVAEGAKSIGGKTIVKNNKLDDFGRKSLGGVGEYLSKEINKATGLDTRSFTLGHVQRGGTPCAYDRRMGRYYGIAAANLIFRKEFGKMVSYKNGSFTAVPLEEAVSGLNLININNMYDTQRYNGLRKILADREKRISADKSQKSTNKVITSV
jgi:6-phosphofructokinase